MEDVSQELPAVPRSNTTPSDTPSPSRPRTRGPARSSSTTRRAAGADEAANRTLSAQSAEGARSSNNPTYDEIAEAAYHRYLKRGGGDGSDYDDWLEAERDLRSRRTS
jgi:hypothetical protein